MLKNSNTKTNLQIKDKTTNHIQINKINSM